MVLFQKALLPLYLEAGAGWAGGEPRRGHRFFLEARKRHPVFARLPLVRALHVATFNGERGWEVESGRGPREEGTAET